MSDFASGDNDLVGPDPTEPGSDLAPRILGRRGGETGALRDRFHLAIASRQPLSPEAIKHVAAVLRRTPYDIRARFRGDLPKPIVYYDTVEEAESAAASLRGLGLVTIVFRERSLPPAKPFLVHEVEITADGFEVKDRHGSRRSVRGEELLLIVCGRRTTRSVETGFHLVLRDSNDHSSVSLERTAERHSNTNGFVLWFPQGADQAPLEFRADQFEYTCLGRRAGLSDDVNFPRLIEAMQGWLPQAAFDRRLLDAGVEDLVASYYNRRLGVDAATASATLVFWQHLAEHGGQNHFTFRDPT